MGGGHRKNGGIKVGTMTKEKQEMDEAKNAQMGRGIE